MHLAIVTGGILAAFSPVALAQVVNVTLTSTEGTVDLGPGYTSEPALLYNGQVPGPEIGRAHV